MGRVKLCILQRAERNCHVTLRRAQFFFSDALGISVSFQ